MDKIAVLIPCYNEEQTIYKVVNEFKNFLPNATIYVYDNNSSDRTAEEALKAGAIVRHEYMQGKGNVVRRMFREIDAEVYIMVDGDDTYPAEAAKTMIDILVNRQAAMVVGDRLSSTYFVENKRAFHNFGNSIVRYLINKLFNTDIKDIMTGYRVFSYEFVKTFPVISKGFEIETEMSIHAADKNLQIENYIIEYRDRPKGSVSKLNTFSDGIKVIHTITRLLRTYRPMFFFGMLSFILFTLGIIFLIPVLLDYFKTGLVERFPTLIVCSFIILTSIISLFSGLILNTIAWKNKQDFEIKYIETSRTIKEKQ